MFAEGCPHAAVAAREGRQAKSSVKALLPPLQTSQRRILSLVRGDVAQLDAARTPVSLASGGSCPASRRLCRFTRVDHRRGCEQDGPHGLLTSRRAKVAGSRTLPPSLWRPRHGEGATAPAAAPGLSAPSLARLRGALRSILTTADGGFSRQSRHMRRFRRPGLSLVSGHNARLERGAPARARALLRYCGVRRDHSTRRQSSSVIVVTAKRAAQ